MYCLLLLCMSFALKKEEREREGDIVTLWCEECTIILEVLHTMCFFRKETYQRYE